MPRATRRALFLPSGPVLAALLLAVPAHAGVPAAEAARLGKGGATNS